MAIVNKEWAWKFPIDPYSYFVNKEIMPDIAWSVEFPVKFKSNGTEYHYLRIETSAVSSTDWTISYCNENGLAVVKPQEAHVGGFPDASGNYPIEYEYNHQFETFELISETLNKDAEEFISTFAEGHFTEDNYYYIEPGIYEWVNIPNLPRLAAADANAINFTSNNQKFTHMHEYASVYPGTDLEASLGVYSNTETDTMEAFYQEAAIEDPSGHPEYFLGDKKAYRIFTVEKGQYIQGDLAATINNYAVECKGILPDADSYYPISGASLNEIRRILDAAQPNEYSGRCYLSELSSQISDAITSKTYDGYQIASNSDCQITSWPQRTSYDPLVYGIKNKIGSKIQVLIFADQISQADGSMIGNFTRTIDLEPYQQLTFEIENPDRDFICAHIQGFKYI